MDLIDTHCHIDVEAFDDDRETVIEKAKQAGVKTIIIPAVASAGWHSLIALSEQNVDLHFALGLHPYFVDKHSDNDLEELVQMLDQEHAVAVGEIGLDYYDKHLNQQKQRYFFEAQVKIAEQYELPIIVHARKSHDDIIQILKKEQFSRGGIMHAFNGSIQQAETFIKLGFKLGFGGMLTYERSTKLRSLAKALPLEAIVLETDSPDMTVQSHRGQRNSPEYLPEVLQSLADVRQQRVELVAAQTTANANAVLRLI